MSGAEIVADHLSKHHDDTVGVQETGGVSLIQPDLCLHRCPGTAAEVVVLSLRAGNLQIAIFIRAANTPIINQCLRARADTDCSSRGTRTVGQISFVAGMK